MRSVVAIAVLLGIGVGLFVWLLRKPDVLPPKDFVEYWTAARLALDGGDPYDGDQLLPLQQAAANEPERTEAVMMWNPPWTLPLYLPWAKLDPRPAQLLWLGLQFALIVVSCVMLWKLYDGPPEHLGAVPLIAVSFYATLWTIKYGQNTGFLLLGLAGFAFFTQRNRPIAAGVFAALTALKPHLLAPFGVLLVLNAFRPRGLVTLIAGVGTIAIGLGIAVLVDPNILDQYLAATQRSDAEGTTKPLSGWALPQAAFYLRIWFTPEKFWVQFIPCAVACACAAVYFWLRRKTWNWEEELPTVVWVSVLTAAYGGWIFDLAVLLVPVMQAAVWLAKLGTPANIRLFAACYGALTMATFVFAIALDAFWWVAPATLALCLAAWAATHPRDTLRPAFA